MAALRLFWHQAYDLAVTTATVWWRLLPKLLSIQLLGWAALNTALRLGAFVLQYSTWPAIVILAIGLVGLLMSYIASLRLVGDEIGIGALVSSTNDAVADTDNSLISLLAATLLPFLGIYAAFRYIEDQAGQMFILGDYMGGGAFGRNILAEVNPLRSPQAAALTIGLLVGVYVVRRLLDVWYGRTHRRVLGLVAAVLEAVFLLVLIFSGRRLIIALEQWWKDQAFHGWFETLGAGLALSLEPMRVNLPEVVRGVSRVIGTGWKFFLDGTVEPLAWLAVAALVFGTHMLSLAQMWGKGQPLATQVFPATRWTKPRSSTKAPSGVMRRAWLELQEAFVGDIDDRYLPTLQSIRIVIRPGLTFLAAYLVLYGLLTRGESWLKSALIDISGGQQMAFWLRWQSSLDLLCTLAYQPLVLVLFGVTFHRCLIRLRGQASAKPVVSATTASSPWRLHSPPQLKQPSRRGS